MLTEVCNLNYVHFNTDSGKNVIGTEGKTCLLSGPEKVSTFKECIMFNLRRYNVLMPVRVLMICMSCYVCFMYCYYLCVVESYQDFAVKYGQYMKIFFFK